VLYKKHLRLAGRGPNNDFLFPPLAAVAPKGGATGVPVRLAWDEQSLIYREI